MSHHLFFKLSQRQTVRKRWFSSNCDLKRSYDAIVIGGGHNGLTAAAYLQQSGYKVCVLEKRHLIGGAAITEEIIPGFKFSRLSYVLSLFRPIIIKELELKKHGLKVFLRNPHSFTPLSKWENGKPKSLTLHLDKAKTLQEISAFSQEDAKAYLEFDHLLTKVVSSLDPLLDHLPPNFPAFINENISWQEKVKALATLKPLYKTCYSIGKDLPFLAELLLSSASKLLNKRFESEPLKATLATDGVIGAMQAPSAPGSGYLLLHHAMGSLEGMSSAWGYVQGGMGAVSQAIGKAASLRGAEIFTERVVAKISTTRKGVEGVVLENGVEVKAPIVLSNATPKVTFLELIDQQMLPENFRRDISSIDYTSPTTKINVALKGLPNFLSLPNCNSSREPMPHHQATIHINCESIDDIETAYLEGKKGKLPDRPMIEFVIPSTLDNTLAPPGHHVCLIFSQFTPYHLANGRTWNEETKREYFDIVVNSIETYAPGFRDLIIGHEVLCPVDLENIFGLTGGNIFHGALTLDQLFSNRPTSLYRPPYTPINGLYLCGSGSHPGGGVMGSPGRLGALTAIKEFRKKNSK